MAGGFSMSQQLHLSANAQGHLVDCRSHFFALEKANRVLSNYRYISNNCANILNATLVVLLPYMVDILAS
jgi:hypothetical protein